MHVPTQFNLFVMFLFLVLTLPAQSDERPYSPLIGRWDLEVEGVDGAFPSWLEIRKSGNATLVGSFVAQFGSARPISKVHVEGDHFRFEIPPQWEQRTDDIVVSGDMKAGQLAGETTDEKGNRLKWHGKRAPKLQRNGEPTWGPAIKLFDGKSLDGWHTLLDGPNGWVVRDGILFNQTPGNNIATDRKFNDFQLHAEFRYPKGSNSGIYLRGRYEVQIEDNYGDEAESHKIGGVYGFLTPSNNAAKQHGEWQTYDLQLVGRELTVHLNGQRVIDRQTIPGITGGALDSNEGEPGPIYLQGDHGPVEFRELTLKPGK